MSKQLWQEAEPHPPLAVLVLYLEGELYGSDVDRTKRHLQDCWDCRRQLACLEQGIYAFIDYRREVLIPSLPQFSDSPGLLRRLRQEAERGAGSSLLQAMWRILESWVTAISRPAWISGTVSVITILAILHVAVFRPPQMEAAEFLRRACAAVPALEQRPRTALYQRVRIRRGSYVFEQSVRHGTTLTSSSPQDVLTNDAMRSVGIDWRDPLNARRFADWHDAQFKKRDRIFQSQASITLQTTPSHDGDVQYASLTVNNIDWRPIAEHVEFRNGPPLDLTEISAEIRELSAPMEASASQPSSVSASTPERDIPTTVLPSEAQLDDAEVQLREAFHQLGADVREIPTIRRQDHEIVTTAFADSAPRRKEILTAIKDIPFVSPQIDDPDTVNQTDAATSSSTSRAPQANSPAGLTANVIEPPLAQSLADYLGGLDRANDFLINTRNAYLRTLVDASALRRLADRYPDTEWDRLSPQSRTRLDSVAGDYLEHIQTDSREYLYLVEPIFKTMVQRLKISVAEQTSSRNSAPGCASWRTDADSLLASLQASQSSFQHLFIAYQGDAGVTMSSDAMLRDSMDTLSILKQHLNQLCQP